MAKGSYTESFETTWKACCSPPYRQDVSLRWIECMTYLIISRIKRDRDRCKNLNKIDLHNRRIKFLLRKLKELEMEMLLGCV